MEEVVLIIMLGLGLFLLALGIIMGGVSILANLNSLWLEIVAAGAGLLGMGAWVSKLWRGWTQEARIQRADQSELAGQLTPLLFGNHPPYVIEAAEKLGQARDTTAVPHLVYALEQCVETQPPCWCEMGEALVNALASIGDRRALLLLYRLENVRGIGFITAIRNAIASIEPPTSLLRPGSADGCDHETLLHPAQSTPDDSPQVLLHTVEAKIV